jgi:hypothetical protein
MGENPECQRFVRAESGLDAGDKQQDPNQQAGSLRERMQEAVGPTWPLDK